MALLGHLTVNSSPDDVAEAIIKETIRRGYQPEESIAADSTGRQESGLRPKAVNGAWRGIYQQDASYPGRDDPNENIRAFLDRLDVKRKSAGASSDIWKNIFWLQQRPGERTADLAFANGRQAYLTEIRSKRDAAVADYKKYAGVAVADNRPDFNEFALWSPNCSGRNGTKVDLFLLHTQEGGGGDSAAEDLAKYLANPASQVSYHYTGSQAADNGVTVVDCVDTDDASWSVLDANPRSINFCFAGARASDSRDVWLSRSRVIDVAAYLAVQDAKKYGFTARVLKPPYSSNPPGISDHRYVTQWLKIGTHTDVGDNFPWDYFEQRVAFWAGTATTTPTTPTTPTAPVKRFPKDYTDRELLEYIAAQLGPWPQLGQNAKGENLTLVDAFAEFKKAAA
ncbi:N-acetylmuramoyl-L-alanine amidase [Mycolicibacterium sphagni]|uniref:N-acetylmuramoyl-L-alanine amidase n=1 Tax=Mycolicibacterium sphagni TaxID=1786 RepID=A0A255DSX2_9MYCO|nr:N-acetylmuramoyl-L-alanine amidase [Mycolicibacterium sphagni]OYN81791.1 N-acetylmuramoyl-L-alanine amidase [Mycolicibacterium sphagni]